jgi:hypothetical protein
MEHSPHVTYSHKVHVTTIGQAKEETSGEIVVLRCSLSNAATKSVLSSGCSQLEGEWHKATFGSETGYQEH